MMAKKTETPVVETPAKTERKQAVKKPAVPAKKALVEKAVAAKPAAKKPPEKATAKEAVAKSAPAKPGPGRPKNGETRQAGPIKKSAPRNLKPVPIKKTKATKETVKEALKTITPKEIEFVEVYLTCYNGTRSYMKVFGTDKYASAASQAYNLFKKHEVNEYLAKRMSEMFHRTEEAQDKLINQYQQVAYGDANELMEYRRESCRYCHGKKHLYHYTPQEFRDAQAAHAERKKEAAAKGEEIGPFDPLGGIGFSPKMEPHPDCPECHGDGIGREIFKDSRTLSPAGLALYAGVKVTKDGVEIKTRSQERASEMLARILKLYEDKTEINMNFSVDELQETFASRMAAAQAKARQVQSERNLPDE